YRSKTKKIAPDGVGATVRLLCRVRLPNDSNYPTTIYAPGVGSQTLISGLAQRILAEQAQPAIDPPRALSDPHRCPLSTVVSDASFSKNTVRLGDRQDRLS